MTDFNVDKFCSNPTVAALEVGLKKIDWIDLGFKVWSVIQEVLD